MDFPLNPIPQIADAGRARVLLLENRVGRAVAWEALAQRTFLVGGLEPCDLDGVAGCQLAFVERLLHRRDKLGQFEALVLCGAREHVALSRRSSIIREAAGG